MSQYPRFPAERQQHSATVPDSDHDRDAHAPSGSHLPLGPPPSYDDLAIFADVDTKDGTPEPDTSFGASPTQVPFEDLITGSSERPVRRSLPPPPRRASPPAIHIEHPETLHGEQSDTSVSQPSSPTHSRTRPQLPHAPRSAPDPRARARLEHIQELEEVDQFGNRFHDESPFEAGRRAQRVDSANAHQHDAAKQAYANGRMPSVKPGEIMPVTTMLPPNGIPAFFLPSEAPPFPPTIHAPIRPAHFPPQLHPPAPSPAPARSHSHRHPAPPPAPPAPSRTQSQRHPLPPQPPQPPQPLRTPSHGQPPAPPPPPTRASSHRYPVAPVLASQIPPVSASTYNTRDGVPPGLAPNGRYGTPPLAPYHQARPTSIPQPLGYPHPQAQSHPRGPPFPPQPQPQPPARPTRSILREQHRRSEPALYLSTPAPTPVRLPSQNVPPPAPGRALNGVPSPSGSPRPDPSRAPRATPKPVMPQLLAPLAQEYSYGHGGAPQLQRSASSVPLKAEKSGGLLSKTRSILKKRHSSSGIKTHADGAMSFASHAIPAGPTSKRYENQAPVMPTLREEGGGAKLAKRLSKRR